MSLSSEVLILIISSEQKTDISKSLRSNYQIIINNEHIIFLAVNFVRHEHLTLSLLHALHIKLITLR